MLATIGLIIVLCLAAAASAREGSITPTVQQLRHGLKLERSVTNRVLERRCRPGRHWPQVRSVWAIPRRHVEAVLQRELRRQRYARTLNSRCWDVPYIIRRVFGAYGSQAVRVAYCESRFSTRATNGQYLGLFQMGSSERATYGHGATALAQSRAAHRYFVASGRDWSPWQCRPWGLAW